ncbi:MAG: hypothetical protein K0R65_1914 [Crocinitomicaceae bacterium]|nr:hypothetical protein [Crocinitomicaceae bacterium]
MLNGSLRELFKVPVMITHFTEHQKVNEDLSLLEFLSMHYVGDDMNDKDQDRDMELPFKKIDISLSLEIIAVPLAKLDFEKKQIFHTPKTTIPASRDSNVSSPFLNCLFRPPIA